MLLTQHRTRPRPTARDHLDNKLRSVRAQIAAKEHEIVNLELLCDRLISEYEEGQRRPAPPPPPPPNAAEMIADLQRKVAELEARTVPAAPPAPDANRGNDQ